MDLVALCIKIMQWCCIIITVLQDLMCLHFKGAAFVDHLCAVKATAIWDIYCLQMLWIVLKHSLSWVTATELLFMLHLNSLLRELDCINYSTLLGFFAIYCNDILLIYAHLILAVLDICVLHIDAFTSLSQSGVWFDWHLALNVLMMSAPPPNHTYLTKMLKT